MNRKKTGKIILKIVAGLLVIWIAGRGACAVFQPYVDVIYPNWKIELPKGHKIVYSKLSEMGFQGDGERYHIFQYPSEINSSFIAGFSD